MSGEELETRRLGTLVKLVTAKAGREDFKVGLEQIEGWTGRLVESDVSFEGEGVAFKAGDVLFAKLRPYLAKLWVADRAGAAVGDFVVLRTRPRVSPRFIAYSLLRPEYIDLISAGVYGSKMPRVSWEILRDTFVPVRSYENAEAIADFIEQETAGIDAFIADQEELIALLKERRESVVNDLVLPASGEHWSERPFLSVFPRRVDYRGATPSKVASGIQLVTARNIKVRGIDYRVSTEYVARSDYDAVMRRGKPKVGELLFTMEAPLGNVGLVDRTDIAIAQRVIKLTPERDVLPRFAMYALSSQYFQRQLRERATGSTALGIKASKLSELRVWLPSLAAQARLVEAMDVRLQTIEDTIAYAHEVIALSKERRAALISAAVTGQIHINEKKRVLV